MRLILLIVGTSILTLTYVAFGLDRRVGKASLRPGRRVGEFLPRTA